MASGGAEKKDAAVTNIISALPIHIISVIFSKLPMPSLPVCRQVCKTWNYLLLDSAKSLRPNTSFVGIANDTTFTRLDQRQSFDMYCFNFDAKRLEKQSHVASFKLDPDWSNIKIISACNGLLCISHEPSQVGLLNPITNEYLQISREKNCSTLGLGFSPKTKQYKLVKVVRYYRDDHSLVKIFTFGGTSKRSCIASQSLGISMRSEISGVYFNGALYWSRIDSRKNVVICRMDVEDERFDMSPLPVEDFCNEAIWASNDNIYVTLRDRVCDKFQVWMMEIRNGGEKLSWIRKFVGVGIRVDWGILSRQVLHLQLIKVYEDGEMLFLVYGFHLFLYDPKIGKIKTTYDYTVESIASPWIYRIESLNFYSLEKILGGDG